MILLAIFSEDPGWNLSKISVRSDLLDVRCVPPEKSVSGLLCYLCYLDLVAGSPLHLQEAPPLRASPRSRRPRHRPGTAHRRPGSRQDLEVRPHHCRKPSAARPQRDQWHATNATTPLQSGTQRYVEPGSQKAYGDSQPSDHAAIRSCYRFYRSRALMAAGSNVQRMLKLLQLCQIQAFGVCVLETNLVGHLGNPSTSRNASNSGRPAQSKPIRTAHPHVMGPAACAIPVAPVGT